jgi:hypothetical protein
MHSKLSRSVIWSTAILTGAVLLTSIAPSSACPFKQKLNPTDTTTSINPSGLTNSSINTNRPDLNKLGIASASLAALLGLYGGGLFLKARFAKRQSPSPDVLPPTSVKPHKQLPSFPIVVPAEVLNEKEAEITDEVSSTR